MYTAKKNNNGSIRWACTEVKKESCKGAVTTDGPMGNARKLTAQPIERRGCRGNEVPTNDKGIAATKHRGKDERYFVNGNAKLVRRSDTCDALSLKRDIQRQKAKTRPVEPQSIQAINVVHPWTSTGGAHPVSFLIHDSGPLAVAQRIIVYAGDDALTHPASSDTWFMDGNFKSAPGLFEQVYVIRAKLDDGAVSCVYAFLPGKDQVLYTELFTAVQRKIQALGLAVNVRTITVDFERGAYNAFRNVFGQQIVINGCFFHLIQSTFRKACELGLRRYIVDGSPQFRQDIRMFVGMIDALAFVPLGHLNVAGQVLINNIPEPMLRPLLDYFLTNYVFGPVIPNRVPPANAPPMFPPQLWNIFQVTIQGGSRTNNICEG